MKNRWDERYRAGDYGDKQPEPLVTRIASTVAAGTALDIACGLGRNSIWLAQQGWNVTAIDHSEVALKILRERMGNLPIAVRRIDLEKQGLDATRGSSYDLICDCCFLWRPLFAPMFDALREGGVFVGVYLLAGDEAVTRLTKPEYLIGPGELDRLFKGWDVLHLFEGRPGGDPSRRLRAEIAARKRPA